MTQYQLKGTQELLAFLSAFPEKLQKGAVRAALTAAAKPIRDEARQQAPRETGKLAKAIRTGSPRVNQDGTVSIRISLKGEHAFLGIFHEYGVRPHLISVQEQEKPFRIKRDGRREAFSMKLINRMTRDGSLVIGDKFVGPKIEHPGHPAHPFMRPALDIKATDAINAFGERIRSYLSGKTGFTAPQTIEVDE